MRYGWISSLCWLFLLTAALGDASTNRSSAAKPALTLEDLAKKRLDMVKNQPLGPDSCIFDGAAFPKIDFMNRDLVEAAVGTYSLQIRFFDAQWKEVTAPQAPGRYGAVVNFHTADGLDFSHDVTLFKTPHPFHSRKDIYTGTFQFPPAFGFPEDLARKEAWNVSYSLNNAMQRSDSGDREATIAAAMDDFAKDPTRWHGFDIWRPTDTWWSELHKRLGKNQDYSHLTYLPDGYDKDQRKWPLILFLSGTGERGNDLTKLENQGPRIYIHKGHAIPFIVVSPQCPLDEWWDPARLARLVDQVATTERVDTKRIYVTGLSMGGYGSFDLAATYPDKFAAVAPLSGGENPSLAERLKHIPMWIFHGADDDVVPARYSIDLAAALKKLDAPVKLTIYPGVGHGGWDVTYNNPELYTWFLAHSK